METNCSICNKFDECQHFDIYVSGSEGVYLCQACQVELAEHLRALKRVATYVLKNTYKKLIKDGY